MKSVKHRLWLLFVFFNLTIFSQKVKKDSVKINNLKEVLIVAKDPISRKFSVTKISKLAIYFNPVSNGDALKAITILPASTNSDETANPILRGGAADMSRVYINGAPVLNPVRNNQGNGLGNFSLLNTEMIDKQYVYASNPPLTYGNATAGIVEIATEKELAIEDIQVSAALSRVGFMVNKKITKNSFVQAYGNHHFSGALIGLNKSTLPNLKIFSTNDLGLNARVRLSDNFTVNSFNYFIDESYNAKRYQLNYRDNLIGAQKRFFSINTVDYVKGRSKIRVASLIDWSDKNYNYGNTNMTLKHLQFFLSAYHKYRISYHLTFQYGMDFSTSAYDFDGYILKYYYAQGKNAATVKNTRHIDFNATEIYGYADYKLDNNIGFSAGLRKNIFLTQNSPGFLSAQLAARYKINRHHRLVFSMGNYHSYTTLNQYIHRISQLNSKQIALDYYLNKRTYNFTSAIYYKSDKGVLNSSFTGISFDKINTFGIECSLKYNFNRNLNVGLSNLYLRQRGYKKDHSFDTTNRLHYFIKSQITYSNPKYFTASLAFTTRPGNFYTGISKATFNTNARDFKPIFNPINRDDFGNYYRLDFTANRVFNLHNNALIAYVSINNLLNRKNQSSAYYNSNYTALHYDYYQQRIFYFGVIYRLSTLFNK